MRGLRGAAEAATFLALAVALHLLFFWAQPTPSGQAAGGVGGASSVSMTGASADMTAMVAEWDAPPVAAPAPAEMDTNAFLDEPLRPDAPLDAPPQTAQTARPDVPPKSPEPFDAPPKTSSEAPPADPTLPDIPSPTAPPPAEFAARNQSPDLLAIRPPAPRADPASPPPAPAPPSIPPSEPDVAEVEEETSAPDAAPAPRAKPAPPQRPEKPQAVVEAPRKPAPQVEKANEPSEADPSPGAASRAAGAGGGSDEGAGAAAVSVGPSPAETADLIQIWGGKIRHAVERKKTYPRSSRRAGTTHIAMTVSRTGGLVAARVQKSSGSDRLDSAAMRAIKAAAPYQAAPSDLSGASFNFVLPVVFQR